MSGPRSSCVGAIVIATLGLANALIGRDHIPMSSVRSRTDIYDIGCIKNIGFSNQLWHCQPKDNRYSLTSACWAFVSTMMLSNIIFLAQYHQSYNLLGMEGPQMTRNLKR